MSFRGFVKLAVERLLRKELPMLEVGAPAPDFEVQNQDGRVIRLSDYRGRRVVLWFYPKADTPG